MFRNKAIDLEFKLKDGMAVIISGRASVYSANGLIAAAVVALP